MDRLTFRLGEQNPSYGLEDKASAKPGLFTDYDGFYAHLKAIHGLGQYEDTGLTPAEVAELAQAKADGRVVVLPCKVGDTVYRIKSDGTIDTPYVKQFHISQKPWQTIVSFEGSMCGITDFGKTIFLTREEAEKALREREKNA